MATYVVNADGVNVKTTVTNKANFVDSFITELILSCNYTSTHRPIVGLDVEFSISDDSSDFKAATLQVCSGSRCIIIQLINMETIPQSLFNFLSAPLFCFVGVGIHKSLEMLRMDYGLVCRHAVDLRPVLDRAVLTGLIGVEPKPSSVIFGNWAAGNLSMDQIESAASDAHTFYKFGKLFFG